MLIPLNVRYSCLKCQAKTFCLVVIHLKKVLEEFRIRLRLRIISVFWNMHHLEQITLFVVLSRWGIHFDGNKYKFWEFLAWNTTYDPFKKKKEKLYVCCSSFLFSRDDDISKDWQDRADYVVARWYGYRNKGLECQGEIFHKHLNGPESDSNNWSYFEVQQNYLLSLILVGF